MNRKRTPKHEARRLSGAIPKSGKAAAWLLLVLLLLACLPGCGKKDDSALTIEAVRSLAATKGADLTWGDFARYPSIETGSGLYILAYAIDSDYRLMIGGMPDEAPMYIYLVSTKDSEQRIDIRYDDIDAFLKRTE